MGRLEHDDLIKEAISYIEESKKYRGDHALLHRAILTGRLGELLFHSGRVEEAIVRFEEALSICMGIGDVDGEVAYLGNLMQSHRYRSDQAQAAAAGEQLVRCYEMQKRDAGTLRRIVEHLRQGEPLCRIVCFYEGSELELEEMRAPIEGHIQFRFRRNRPSIQIAETLVRRGNALASSGRLAEALELYQEAAEVDPHDPHPRYQAGVCLLELGAYARAEQSFEEVERLAPGWFRCRGDRWLAGELESGGVSPEEFRLLRTLEDGGLEPEEGLQVARKAIEGYPCFAPFRLAIGNLLRDRGEIDAAVQSYRVGLELASEPDLESRLLAAFAALLPLESPERRESIERAMKLEGSLVAHASARLMKLQDPRADKRA
ncbi:MAG: tetratricopeptide repeat protein [Isosphaeraceae bacterium]